MMAGNPTNWWSMHSTTNSSSASDHHHQHEAEVLPSTNLLISQTHPSNYLLPLQFLNGGSSSSSSSLLPFLSSVDPHAQDFPHSWSQLLLGGLASEQEERFSPSEYEATRVMSSSGVQADVKQEVSSQNNNNHNNNLQLYGSHQFHEEQVSVGVSSRAAAAVAVTVASAAAWTQIMPAPSPKSCITSLSSSNNNTNTNNSNMLDFSTNKRSLKAGSHQHADHTTANSECNSTATTGGAPPKKPTSTPPLKVRKEKLGDRITSLHQLVSPFGKHSFVHDFTA